MITRIFSAWKETSNFKMTQTITETLSSLAHAEPRMFDQNHLKRMIEFIPQHPDIVRALEQLVDKRKELFRRADAIALAKALEHHPGIVIAGESGTQEEGINVAFRTMQKLMRVRRELFL